MEELEAEDRKYKWEITPHPYTTEFDTLVTDDDMEALQAMKDNSESVWDSLEEGEEKTITIRLNKI